MTTSAAVRASLVEALRLDLVGPRTGHPPHARYAAEELPAAPSQWYLTGFLVPFEAPLDERSDDDAQADELDDAGRPLEADDDQAPERASARKAFFPSSLGVSVLVPPGTGQLQAHVGWGDYHPVPTSDEERERTGRRWTGRWTRAPREAERLVDLEEGDRPARVPLDDTGGLVLVVAVRPVARAAQVPAGTRAVSVFLVNERPPAPDYVRDQAYVFQPELTLRSLAPFFPRPDPRGETSDDWDEQVADLQYRDAVEYAVGHNVSAVALAGDGKPCRAVRTAWMPTAEVEKVVPSELEGVELGMEALAELGSVEAVRAALSPMLDAYGRWIDATALPDEPHRRKVAAALLDHARRARARIAAGLDSLADADALAAFRLSNRAIAAAIRQRWTHDHEDRSPEDLDPPAWRPFQLAFLLMNLPGVVDPHGADRRVVDLLFFPTGGGKTEAYLGLAAFVMVLRRLRDPSVRSSGVSVLMRYTLRLLTLDQLGRAATLVCALELERQQDVARLGQWPFEIGLWVGRGATPNRMGAEGDKDRETARQRTLSYQRDPKRRPSPIPLECCPWCGWRFDRDSFRLLPDASRPEDLRVSCRQRRCEFHSRRQQRGLPILAVDEPIYRRLPAFLIATVDKFASLPWVGETAGLFGRVERHDAAGFYGPARPGIGRSLDGHLPPPDLVIQDELHLISGPLGTMVGLYETAIDALAGGVPGELGVRPKVVASTATVRRAERQIRALFGRNEVDVFPPPGPDRRDSFFARTVPPSEKSARTYVGVAAQGRNLKVVLLRSCLALLAAAEKAWAAAGGKRARDNPADPYMTLLGYFNSLRELGGSRRIVEDEVTARLADYGERRLRVGEALADGLLANRPGLQDPEELTSRVPTNEVADTKRRLALSYRDKERLDVVLATNMISVGLDITRLGLMVVLGQPKTAAEYIQATSRVGRDDARPGLVVTLLNLHRPRDRSHYECFSAWHESFYRAVEASSVTPFSPRAIDRGLAAVTVALARLGHAGLTAPQGALAITGRRPELDFVAEVISRRAEGHDQELDAEAAEALRQRVRGAVEELLDTWQWVAEYRGDLQYAREAGRAPHLLFDPLDRDLEAQPREARRFKAHRSMRDVEPTVNLWFRRAHEDARGDEP